MTKPRRTTAHRSRSTKQRKTARSSMPWTQIVIAFVVAVMAVFGYNRYNNSSTNSGSLPPSAPQQSLPKTPNNNQPKSNQPTAAPTNGGSISFKIASWNLYNFGNTKQPEAMRKIAQLITPFDIIALQEISTTAAGAQGVAQLAELLNEGATKWDYTISDRTTGEGSERYAYIWKTNKATLMGRSFLTKAQNLDEKIDREPFMARFKFGKNVAATSNQIMIANYHAVPITKKPEREIVLLSSLDDAYSKDNLLIVGDFNLEQNHNAFKPIRAMGYEASLIDQKTSIKLTNTGGEYLSKPYDNIFYETATLTKLRSGVVDFVPDMPTIAAARQVSDHLPVWCELRIR